MAALEPRDESRAVEHAMRRLVLSAIKFSRECVDYLGMLKAGAGDWVGCETLMGTPPHHVDPKSGYRVWFVANNGVVGELAPEAAFLDDAVATFICGDLWSYMQRRNSTGGRYTFVHDWSRLKTYTKNARMYLMHFLMQNHRVTENCGIVLSTTNAFTRVSALAAAAAIRLIGFDMRIADTASELCAGWNLRAERPNIIQPL